MPILRFRVVVWTVFCLSLALTVGSSQAQDSEIQDWRIQDSDTQGSVIKGSENQTTGLTLSHNIQKRQFGDHLCMLPEPLTNGRYFPHFRRCPAGDNSAACRLVPGAPVSTGWVLLYTCHLGYRLNTSRIASICLHKGEESRWVPALPRCLKISYNSTSPFLRGENECGRPLKHSHSKRSVDGTVSRRGAWPWLVIFGHPKTSRPQDGYHWFCAGTLITTKHILTAAKCVHHQRNRPVFVARFDDLHLNESVNDGAEPIQVSIDRRNVAIHPGFHIDVVFSQNIAVVKLKTQITVTDYVKPICLPSPDFEERDFSDEAVIMASWGQTDDDSERNHRRKSRYEPVLHSLSGTVVGHDTCSYNYRGYQSQDTPVIISHELICADIPSNASCQGDVGSPLMIERDGVYFLLGVVATEFRCFDDQYPRLFTRLSSYMNWILVNIKY